MVPIFQIFCLSCALATFGILLLILVNCPFRIETFVVLCITSFALAVPLIDIHNRSEPAKVKTQYTDTLYVHDTVYILYDRQQEKQSEESNWKK